MLQTSPSPGPRLAARLSAGTRLALDLMPLAPAAVFVRAALVAVENPALRIVTPEGAQGFHPLFDPEGVAAAGDSLVAHVLRQIETLRLTAREKIVALALTEALEPTGWLGVEVAVLARACGVAAQEMERVLHRLQQLEPSGLFARTLAECLRIQAIDAGELTPAMEAVLEGLPRIAEGDAIGVARDSGLPPDAIERAVRKIRTFNPKPGLVFTAPMPVTSPPDVIARRGAGGWRAERHPATPRFERRKDMGDPVAARLWAQALARRADLGLMIADQMVQRQSAFLDGTGDMRPLTSQELAQATGLHVSTVNRIVKGTVMATPARTAPLRHWMARPLRAEGGASTAAARHRLGRLLSDPGTAGLSDAALTQMLEGEGIRIARRTVAKYRLALMGRRK